MGIDNTVLEALLLSLKYVKNKNNALTLGRQGIHTRTAFIEYFLKKYNNYKPNMLYEGGYCEPLLYGLDFSNVESIDASSYEDASIIHNMNIPLQIPIEKNKLFDFILDGGTIEHIFNMPQVCENIIDLLNVDGIFCSVTCNNNFSGHGMYQFSPEFFLSVFSERYGMKILHLYLARVNTEIHEWMDVNTFSGGRNTSAFETYEQVYIITIATVIILYKSKMR